MIEFSHSSAVLWIDTEVPELAKTLPSLLQKGIAACVDLFKGLLVVMIFPCWKNGFSSFLWVVFETSEGSRMQKCVTMF